MKALKTSLSQSEELCKHHREDIVEWILKEMFINRRKFKSKEKLLREFYIFHKKVFDKEIQKALDDAFEDGRVNGINDEDGLFPNFEKRVLEIIDELKEANPYPDDIYVSDKGTIARLSWNNCCLDMKEKIKEVFK